MSQNPKYVFEVWSKVHRTWVIEGWCETHAIAARFADDERLMGRRARVRYVAGGMP